MSKATAIGMVSRSLKNLLIGEMGVDPKPDVTLLAPDETKGNRRINLFLYKVQENPTLKNMDWEVKPDSPDILVPPPLSLDLFYIMTPYALNDPQSENASAHEILGEAMRVFYENPIVPENYLDDGLKGSIEQIKIMLRSLNMEELSMVWPTFTQPYRLSILYEVSVVQLDMLSESERVMAERVRHIGVPEMRAPFNPPVVEAMTPINGPPGTAIIFHGKNLSSWWAYVRIMNFDLAPVEIDEDDAFQATMPDDLPLGFHEVRVDISHLFRRTFFFEAIK